MTRSATRSSLSIKSSVGEENKKYITRSVLESSDLPILSPKTKKNVVFVEKLPPGKKSQKDKNTSFMSDEGVGDLGPHFYPSSSFISEIPSMLVKPMHPLKQAWTLWYYRNDRTLTWEENQQAVATVDTIEEFWQLYQLLQPASKLGLGCDYALFRAGIIPDWEDPANVAGGRWLIKTERSKLDDAWLELLIFLIGEHGDNQAGQVNGAVVNRRKKGDKVAVWLRDVRNMPAVVDIGRQVKSKLNLRPTVKIQFSVHKEDRERAEGKGGERLPDILL